MRQWFYRGITSRQLYELASPLVDDQGHQVVGGQYSIATYNGEYVVYANRDGSVARGVAGPGMQIPASQPGIGTNTLPTVTPSAWESLAASVYDQFGGTLSAPLPMTLGF